MHKTEGFLRDDFCLAGAYHVIIKVGHPAFSFCRRKIYWKSLSKGILFCGLSLNMSKRRVKIAQTNEVTTREKIRATKKLSKRQLLCFCGYIFAVVLAVTLFMVFAQPDWTFQVKLFNQTYAMKVTAWTFPWNREKELMCIVGGRCIIIIIIIIRHHHHHEHRRTHVSSCNLNLNPSSKLKHVKILLKTKIRDKKT